MHVLAAPLLMAELSDLRFCRLSQGLLKMGDREVACDLDGGGGGVTAKNGLPEEAEGELSELFPGVVTPLPEDDDFC